MATIKRFNKKSQAKTRPLFGEGISEMRIFVGPGYRLYYTIRHKTIILMLCGGDKSTQAKDIKKAKKIAQAL